MEVIDPEAYGEGGITYTLGGQDASWFDIERHSGRLKTKFWLDYETGPNYTVTVTATDKADSTNTDAITVTVTVTNVNEPPTFEGFRLSRRVDENTPSGQPIGRPFEATDPENDTLFFAILNGTPTCSPSTAGRAS